MFVHLLSVPSLEKGHRPLQCFVRVSLCSSDCRPVLTTVC